MVTRRPGDRGVKELFKINCPERGCDRHVARVAEDGGEVVIVPLRKRHRGESQDPRLDVRSLLAKLRRVRPDLVGEAARER